MHTSKFIALFALAAACAQGALAQSTTIFSADGTRLTAVIDLPAGDAKVPAVVLAPGQGYHMALPAMEATARALTEQGVAVFRFNWAYFTAEPKGQPSPGLAKELQDLQAVLATAKSHPRVLPQGLAVGGKSLGSVVAWRALAADKSLRGALMLTPVCSRVPKGDSAPKPEAKENYPGLELEQRPTLWISGDRDPLCAPSVLYGFAMANAQAARVAIVGGDHSYENRTLEPAPAEAALKRNLAAVSVLSASFISELSSLQR